MDHLIYIHCHIWTQADATKNDKMDEFHLSEFDPSPNEVEQSFGISDFSARAGDYPDREA